MRLFWYSKTKEAPGARILRTSLRAGSGSRRWWISRIIMAESKTPGLNGIRLTSAATRWTLWMPRRRRVRFASSNMDTEKSEITALALRSR